MAYIGISDITNTTCRLSLYSLDTSWGGGRRTCKWYFKTGSYPTESNYEKKMTSSISGSPAEVVEAWKMSRLTANKKYYCLCCIYSGTTLLASLKQTFSTYPTVSLNSLSVSQTKVGVKKATVSWSGSNIKGGYYYLYANGWLKAEGTITANSMSKTISFDNFGTFTIEVSGDHYNQSFSRSRDVAIEDVHIDLTPEFEGATRGYRSLTFKWSGAYDAERFYARLKTSEKTYGVTTTLRTCTFKNLSFATTYTFSVKAYGEIDGESVSGEESFNYPITTLPAPPTLTVAQNNGYISVDYGIVDTSNIGSFTFLLYNGSKHIESKTIYNSASNQNPNGSFTFSTNLSDGTYTIKAYTTYNSLNSITSDGSSYVIKTISVNLKPAAWIWENVSSGQPTTNISYTTWNSFIDRIREWLDYKSITNVSVEAMYGYESTTYAKLLSYAKMSADDKVLTAIRFNIVRYCIGSMNSTGLTDKSRGDKVYASYFLTLADKMNSIT